MNRKKKLPIGIENFEKIRTQGFYYVDKTGMISDLLDNWGEVNLFTRPRRFGKSLNMSMLKSFFELGTEPELFDGLQIAQDAELCSDYMGQFPVISISLKGVSAEDFTSARAMLCTVIGNEAMRFQYLLENDILSEKEKMLYHQLTSVGEDGEDKFTMADSVLVNSLLTLSQLLCKYNHKKVIILIDEYDVPLDKAHQFGYYDEMTDLIRRLFNLALKSNDSLMFSAMTGCLRIYKESIFTGLNNPQILSITDVTFDEYFGFTDQEVRELLEYYQFMDHYEVVKEWYDGYRFGHVDVFCPWDVISYCAALKGNPAAQPKDYWTNTSGNDVVRHFINEAKNATTKREIEKLIAGECIAKEIHQELTYKELYDSLENMWSVLFTTGYLTQEGEAEESVYQLRIPNLEIRHIFTRQIYKWFQETVVRIR